MDIVKARLSRREISFFLGLSSFYLGKTNAQPATFNNQIGSIDHLELFVRDLSQTLNFYTQLFGNDLWKNNQTPRRYLMFGQAYIALEVREEIKMDHYCIGIEDFDISAVHDALEQQNISYQDYPSGNDLRIDDLDGIRTQLAQNHTWEQLSGSTASPESYQLNSAPIFKPLGLDHLLLKVTDITSASLFYEKFLGKGIEMENGQIHFMLGNSSLGLVQISTSAETTGIEHFAVKVGPFDYEPVLDALRKSGSSIDAGSTTDFIVFTDPDGYRVQVTS